jgi:hypothetical protein
LIFCLYIQLEIYLCYVLEEVNQHLQQHLVFRHQNSEALIQLEQLGD